MKQILNLNNGWRIRQCNPNGEAIGKWLKADMPKQVHEILHEYDMLGGDPREYRGSEKCQWVADNDWEYMLEFAAPTEVSTSERLVLHGVDTLADIFLNGEKLGSHKDLYLPAIFDVTGKLLDKNILSVRFFSPNEYIKNNPLPEHCRGIMSPHRIMRKHEHDFSDYLGAPPRFTKIGIYSDVFIELIDSQEITDLYLYTELKDGNKEGAIVAELETCGEDISGTAEFVFTKPDGSVLSKIEHQLDGKCNKISLKVPVKNPELWWPIGYGEQPLYKVSVRLLSSDGKQLDSCKKLIGIRDVISYKPLQYRINGIDIKLWGTNYTPIDGFTHVFNVERMKKKLDLIEMCTMNSIRVWGGGERNEKALYDECDRRGILVWQDFPNEYGCHPDTEEYRSLCRLEAEYYAKQLRSHTCLIQWCGGNEMYMGRDFSYPGKDFIGHEIFAIDYKQVLGRLDPLRPYLPSSPVGGNFNNDPQSVETHSYTNTWYVPGADMPEFVSENLRVSLPPLRSLERYLGKDNVWPKGYDGRVRHSSVYPWPDEWKYITSTESWRKIPPIERYYDPINIEEMIYNFGWAHADYLRDTVELYRRGNKTWRNPLEERKCHGHLIWKLHATFPHIYSNILDYYLEPGIAYYALKRTYSPLLLSFEVSDFIVVWITNDTPHDFEGKVQIKLFNPLKNEVFKEMTAFASVKSGHAEAITTLNEFKQFDRQNFLYAYIKDDDCSWNGKSAHGFDGLVARSLDYADIERHLKFPNAKPQMYLDGDELVVTTDKFARSIELSGNADGDEFCWYFEDNYFDLVPGETKRIRIFGSHKSGIITAKAAYSTESVSITFCRQ